MKKLIPLMICAGFVSHVFSETLTYGQAIVLCPKEVRCDAEDIQSCHLSDNPYELWDKPNASSSSTGRIKGVFPLGAASANNVNDDINHMTKRISCSYYDGMWENYRAFNVSLKYSPSNIFNKLKKEATNWKDSGFCFPVNKTKPLEPTLCPFVQAPGVSIIDNTDIKLFYPNPNAYFEPNFIANKWLSYDQLYTACGTTSNCIIDIGQCDKENENCSSYGTVYLDISTRNIVKINQVNSYKVPNNPYIFKQKQPFNMIYSQVGVLNQ